MEFKDITQPNTPYAAQITRANLQFLRIVFPETFRHHISMQTEIPFGSWIVYRPLGNGYVEVWKDEDFSRMYEIVAGKYWDNDSYAEKILNKIQQNRNYFT